MQRLRNSIITYYFSSKNCSLIWTDGSV
uniref:Uncharacterized protein n=1 Tax=Anguilla anguilla TaxID=7936 RepID=A0A0E9V1J4_ANGAN